MREETENLIKDNICGDNVCLFGNVHQNNQFLHPYQFVYETMPDLLSFPVHSHHYACHLVIEGSAVLRTEHGVFPLEKGDIFFVFPAVPYVLADCSHCRYLYISFIGSGVDDLLRPYGIGRRTPVLTGYNELIPFWFSGLGKCTADNLPTLTKGILYYTLAMIPSRGEKTVDSDSVIDRIRSAIDRSYNSPDLSLESVCRLYNYNPKYISRKFRETVGVSFSEYLEDCRIRRACVLLTETNNRIQEIAQAVGYRDTAHFSKVFRKCREVPPSVYREQKTVRREGEHHED